MPVLTPPLILLRRACLMLAVLLVMSAPGPRLPDALAGPGHAMLSDGALPIASALPERLTPQSGPESDPALFARRADPPQAIPGRIRAAVLARPLPLSGPGPQAHGARAPPVMADRT
ncbi:hypothetical protein KY389_11015 [Paracoccus bogoriensis]|uniref:hypothetical protein n=1 Tax=Paracoccus bogoriensis TaxID=242065 RepID=UPI001CA4C6A9|nr:hypothetical protein [Paracoccus bogoriensis]MBW7057216.1 hypothetical protein [Paracoccus bogoriensis]